MKRLLVLVALCGALFVWLVPSVVSAHTQNANPSCTKLNVGWQNYPTPSQYTMTVTIDGAPTTFPIAGNGNEHYDWDQHVNHTWKVTTTYAGTVGEGTWEACVKPTTTTAQEETTSTSSSTTTIPDTSTSGPPSTPASTTPTSAPETSGPPPSTPLETPSPPPSVCQASSTNSDISPSSVVTSNDCVTGAVVSVATAPPTSSATSSSQSSLSSLPATGRDWSGTVLVAMLLVTAGILLLWGPRIWLWWKRHVDE